MSLVYLFTAGSERVANAKTEFESLVCDNSSLTAAQIDAASH